MVSSLSRAGFDGVELVFEPVVLMAYGKNGATCWLAGAVCTPQKRVQMLEAKDSFKNVECSIHANTSVSRHKLDGAKPATVTFVSDETLKAVWARE